MSVTSTSDSPAPATASRGSVPKVSPPQPPRIVRPRGLTRAQRPVMLSMPDHHHLPGWVRRAHLQAAPILGDIAGQMDGAEAAAYIARIEALIAEISAGKFSLAWSYPELIDAGYAALTTVQREAQEDARRRHSVEVTRRRVADALRDAMTQLPAEVNSRFSKRLRAAADAESIAALDTELREALASARSAAVRRRDREIDRTRQQILKTSPKSVRPAPTGQESWQDVLRRLVETSAGE